VTGWNKRKGITTVIADEAGQATQPATFPLFSLKAKRYCFVGDHLQLTSGINSSSGHSGLQMSILEWVANAM